MTMTLAQPTLFKDPRCQAGAYISLGRDLYEVLDRRIDGFAIEWLLLENVKTEYKHEFNAKQICANYELVKDAPETPDYPAVA